MLIMVGYTSITVNPDGTMVINPENDFPGTWAQCEMAGNPAQGLMMQRIDAKVKVELAVDPTASVTVDGVTTRPVSFEPESWQVCNLPYSTWLIPHAQDDLLSTSHFNSPVHAFETAEEIAGQEVHGFSFYCLENIQNPLRSVNGAAVQAQYGRQGYHLRDLRRKNPDGTYAQTGDLWEFAPESAPYLVIKGELTLERQEGNALPIMSMAEVVYYVHLGDFGSSHTAQDPDRFDNYSLLRNTQYNYHITLKGVSAIEAEVRADGEGFDPANEGQSGHAGDVSTTVEEIHTFDAHFGQRVFCFNVNAIRAVIDDPSQLTFFTHTPYGRKGIPDRVGLEQVEVPNGLDYKWVHFLINTKEASYIEPHAGVDGGPVTVTNPRGAGYACPLNRAWPQGGVENPELLDVIGLCKYLRDQTALAMAGEPNDFDVEGNLYVTTFVDEYYYDADPITGERRPSMWHEFVNRPKRVMHILCGTNLSLDGESSVTKAVITIKQDAIESIYNLQNLPTGWGSETTDEFQNTLKFFGRNEARSEGSAGNQSVDAAMVSAGSQYNGLYNSVQLWGLARGNATTGGEEAESWQTRYWGEFVDYARPNDYRWGGNAANEEIGFMRETNEMATMRYACLSRNRDENGNGVIDPEEVKWYLASMGQLRLYYVGQLGLPRTSHLYNVLLPRNEQVTTAGNQYWHWRSRVVSSTVGTSSQVNNRYLPEIIWAEEGCSSSFYGQDYGWRKPGGYTLRCVRNLSVYANTPFNALDEADRPPLPVTVEQEQDGSYLFNLDGFNTECLRDFTNTELIPSDEYGTSTRPSRRFRTGGLANNGQGYLNAEYPTIRDRLAEGVSDCPPGWRVPSLREMLLAQIMIQNDNNFWENYGNRMYMVANYYYFGYFGDYPFDTTTSTGTVYTWYFNRSKTTLELGNGERAYIRCVRDQP